MRAIRPPNYKKSGEPARHTVLQPEAWLVPVLGVTVAAHLGLGLGLAASEYHYAAAYRDFAARLEPLAQSQRLWSNAEWGLRYYLEEIGGEPLQRDQQIGAGSIVLTIRGWRGFGLVSTT